MQPNIKISRDISLFLEEIEARFPVDTWQIGSVHIWFLIRLKLGGYLEETFLKHPLDPKPKHQNHFRNLFKLSLNWLRFFRKNKQVKTLVVGHSFSRFVHGGQSYHRFASIFLEKPECAFLEFQESPAEPAIGQDSLAGNLIHYLGFLLLRRQPKIIAVNSYDAFLQFLEEKGFAEFSKELTLNQLQKTVDKIERKSLIISKILRYFKVQKVIVFIYTRIDCLSVILAAKNCGIEVIDHQHALFEDQEFTLHKIPKTPTGGYELQPDAFWCWHQAEVSRITAGPAFAGGSAWHQLMASLPVEVLPKPTKIIFYTTSPTAALLPTALITAIKTSTAAYKWHIRLHPAQLNLKENLWLSLEKEGIQDRVELDIPNRLSLVVLLQNADLHIAHFSSTTIDAATLGIRTVLIQKGDIHFLPKKYVFYLSEAPWWPQLEVAMAQKPPMPFEELSVVV